MAADPNMGFQQGMAPGTSSVYSPVVSFQGGGLSPAFVESPVGIGGVSGVLFGGSPGGICGGLIRSSSAGNLLIESGAVKHDAAPLAADWTVQEQLLLEDGLSRFSSEPSIMRYIKIAARLPDKTVRDVALRCRWMSRKESGKRRKPDENCIGKKMKERKDRAMEYSLNANVQHCQPPDFGAYSFMIPPRSYVNHIPEVIDTATAHLLEENNNLLVQIDANHHVFNLQDNINLLAHARENIMAILQSMRETPGIMQQMPPLQVALHEELASSILPGPSQHTMFGMQPGNQMKQEPHS